MEAIRERFGRKSRIAGNPALVIAVVRQRGHHPGGGVPGGG